MKRLVFCLVALVAIPGVVCADVINLGTAGNAGNWNVIVGKNSGSVSGTAFQDGTAISITSTGSGTGTFVGGIANGQWNGYWAATISFNLPANATNVSLNFSGFALDDRGVLLLNGFPPPAPIGNTGINAPGHGTLDPMPHSGSMNFNYTDITSGTITSGFNIGGTNTLTIIVNNTDSGIVGTMRNFADTTGGDITFARLTADVTFSTPEPASITLFSILAVSGAFYGWRRRQQAAA